MQIRKYFLFFVVVALFLSCLGSKKENAASELISEIVYDTSEIPITATLCVYQEAEDVRELIYKDDKDISNRNLEIVFVAKANFGIPGGDNWIVQLSDRMVIVYLVNDSSVEMRHSFRSTNLDHFGNFNIMQDIPGTHIDNSTSSIFDFNGDGTDEIFSFSSSGMGDFVIITGYDLKSESFISYFRSSFTLLDYIKGPSPVQFMTYRGMQGFKVYVPIPAGYAPGSEWIPNPHPDAGTIIWIFYTWDPEQRMYVEVGKVDE